MRRLFRLWTHITWHLRQHRAARRPYITNRYFCSGQCATEKPVKELPPEVTEAIKRPQITSGQKQIFKQAYGEAFSDYPYMGTYREDIASGDILAVYRKLRSDPNFTPEQRGEIMAILLKDL